MELIAVLDTNAYSDWRRFGRWHENLAQADRVVLPAIVLGELSHGFRKGARSTENMRGLERFLCEPQVEIAQVGRRTAELYGDLLFALQAQGTPLPTNDIWIAVIVSEIHGELLTRDRHFDHIPELRLAKEL